MERLTVNICSRDAVKNTTYTSLHLQNTIWVQRGLKSKFIKGGRKNDKELQNRWTDHIGLYQTNT